MTNAMRNMLWRFWLNGIDGICGGPYRFATLRRLMESGYMEERNKRLHLTVKGMQWVREEESRIFA